MLSATPCLRKFPAKQRLHLVSNAASLVPSIGESTAMSGGPLGVIWDVLLFIHHGRPSSGVKVHLSHHLYITISLLLYYEALKKSSCFHSIGSADLKTCPKKPVTI